MRIFWMASMLAMLLAGCGGSGSDDGGNRPAPPAASYTVGGSISGLTADGLVLTDGTQTLQFDANAAAFSFSTLRAVGSTYAVRVATQPPGFLVACVADASSAKGTITASVSTRILCSSVASTLSTLAGNPAEGHADGMGAKASFNSPYGVAVDATGNVFVADLGNNTIRRVTPSGDVTTYAGTAAVSGSVDGTADVASFSMPWGIAVDGQGNVFVADAQNNKIRKISADAFRVVTTIAGKGAAGHADGEGTAASFSGPHGVAVDASGNVYVADTSNNAVRKISNSGAVTTLAGSIEPGFADGVGSGARFKLPSGIAVDPQGNVYVADTGNHAIRKITPSGSVTTMAGSGAPGSSDGMGADASFTMPSALTVAADGTLYVADARNNEIRRVTAGGVVTTVAGHTDAGNIEGSHAQGRMDQPFGIAVDAAGDLYVGDGNNSVRKIHLGEVVPPASLADPQPAPLPGSIALTGFSLTPSTITAAQGGTVLMSVTLASPPSAAGNLVVFESVREFDATTDDLNAMADWLLACGCAASACSARCWAAWGRA